MTDVINRLMRATDKDINQSYSGTRSLLRIVDPNHRQHIDNMHAMHHRHKENARENC